MFFTVNESVKDFFGFECYSDTISKELDQIIKVIIESDNVMKFLLESRHEQRLIFLELWLLGRINKPNGETNKTFRNQIKKEIKLQLGQVRWSGILIKRD